jgi:hypothetical protein
MPRAARHRCDHPNRSGPLGTGDTGGDKTRHRRRRQYTRSYSPSRTSSPRWPSAPRTPMISGGVMAGSSASERRGGGPWLRDTRTGVACPTPDRNHAASTAVCRRQCPDTTPSADGLRREESRVELVDPAVEGVEQRQRSPPSLLTTSCCIEPARPSRTVLIASSVARATAATPPRPI